MKIIVDNMPDEPQDCLFSEFDWDGCEYDCILDKGHRPCRHTTTCEMLIALKEVKNK